MTVYHEPRTFVLDERLIATESVIKYSIKTERDYRFAAALDSVGGILVQRGGRCRQGNGEMPEVLPGKLREKPQERKKGCGKR